MDRQNIYMYMKFIFAGLLAVIFLSHCQSRGQQAANHTDTIRVESFNVLIAPDLSNRINPSIHPKPVSDTALIGAIAESIPQALKSQHRTTGQEDIYKLDFINKGILNQRIVNPQKLEINFKRFENKARDRSDYIRFKLNDSIIGFKNEVNKVYSYSVNNMAGADIWNYFNETINESLIKPDNTPVIMDPNTCLIKDLKNVVIVFTDGYIENSNDMAGYKLNQQLIKTIRNDFNSSRAADLKTFILSNPKYFIRKTTNDLKGVRALVLELIDRSLDKNGVAIQHPTDFQIMKILWEEWLLNSGCEKVEVFPAVKTKEEIVEKFLNFLL